MEKEQILKNKMKTIKCWNPFLFKRHGYKVQNANHSLVKIIFQIVVQERMFT